MRIADFSFSHPEAEAVFACLVAQLHDIHQPVFSLDGAQVEAAEALFERLPHPSDDALVGVLSLSLMYLVHDTDHFAMSEDEVAAGMQALANFEPMFGPVFA